MTKEELTRLKSQLAKAIDEVVSSGLLSIIPVESLQSITEATRAHAGLDALETGDALKAAMVSRLRDMNDGILLEAPGSDAWAGAKNAYLSCMSFASKVLGVTFNELECEVCGCGEELAPSGVA